LAVTLLLFRKEATFVFAENGKFPFKGVSAMGDDCIVNDCLYGTCVDGEGTYTCECEEGWKGRFCDEDMAEPQDETESDGRTCIMTEGGIPCVFPFTHKGKIYTDQCVEERSWSWSGIVRWEMCYFPGGSSSRCNKELECTLPDPTTTTPETIPPTPTTTTPPTTTTTTTTTVSTTTPTTTKATTTTAEVVVVKEEVDVVVVVAPQTTTEKVLTTSPVEKENSGKHDMEEHDRKMEEILTKININAGKGLLPSVEVKEEEGSGNATITINVGADKGEVQKIIHWAVWSFVGAAAFVFVVFGTWRLRCVFRSSRRSPQVVHLSEIKISDVKDGYPVEAVDMGMGDAAVIKSIKDLSGDDTKV